MSKPFIKPGTYRIQIGQHGQQALLTVAKSATTGEGLIIKAQAQAVVDDTKQQWVVAYTPESDTYTVQSVSTGMYIVCEYPCVNNSNVRLSAKGQQWQLFHDPASPQGVAWFRIPNVDMTVHLYANAAVNGRIVMWAKYAAGSPEQDCVFDPVSNAKAAAIYSPLITHPGVLLPGTYRIRSLSTKNLMAFEDVPHPPTTGYPGVCAVATSEITGNLYQQWKITYVPVSKTFYLLNIGADKYLTSVPPSAPAARLIPASQPQHWDIRQAEFDSPTKGLFAIHIPETNHLVDLASNNTVSGSWIGIWDRGYPLLPQERWIFEPIQFPTGSTNINRPPVVIPPLVQGVYKLRNVGTNNLVTLPPAPRNSNEDGPNLVSNPDADASDVDGGLYQQWIVTYEHRSQTYVIENVKTGTYATSVYVTTNQANLQGGAKPQLWDIRQIEYDGQPETQLIIQLPATEFCFSVDGNSSAPNTRVGLYPRSGAPIETRQRFIFEPVINPSRGPDSKFFGDYVLRNIASGTVLDVSSFGHPKYPSAIGRPANGSLSQHWAISQVPGKPTAYIVRNIGLQMYLSRPPQDADLPGGFVTVTRNPTAWVLNREGASFRLSVEDCDLNLDLTDGNVADGTKVQLKEKCDVPQQRWVFESIKAY